MSLREVILVTDENGSDDTDFENTELLGRIAALTEADIALAELDGAAWSPSPDLGSRILAACAGLADGEIEPTAGPIDGDDNVARPSFNKPRLAPSWVGRWTPALVAAILIVAVAVSTLVRTDSSDDFVPFELASQNGQTVDASYRISEGDDQVSFELKVEGLASADYDVWVRDLEGERVWIGRLDGDTEDFEVLVERPLTDLERLWVTDPEDTVVLESDL
jgi:hypothetical protein